MHERGGAARAAPSELHARAGGPLSSMLVQHDGHACWSKILSMQRLQLTAHLHLIRVAHIQAKLEACL